MEDGSSVWAPGGMSMSEAFIMAVGAMATVDTILFASRDSAE